MNPEPSVQYQSRFDFSQIKTYSFYPRNSDFSELQIVNSAMRNGIELSVEQRLESFGLSYETPDKADVIVSYYVLTPNKKNFRLYNKSVKYCGYCLSFYTGNGKVKSWKQQSGSLLIDLVETQKNRSIWRSIYPLKIKMKDTSQKVQERIDEVISWMFEDNPQHIAGML